MMMIKFPRNFGTVLDYVLFSKQTRLSLLRSITNEEEVLLVTERNLGWLIQKRIDLLSVITLSSNGKIPRKFDKYQENWNLKFLKFWICLFQEK